MAGIMQTSERMAQIYKRRGGCGVDLSTLRPSGATVNNAALQSSGAVGWSNHFSNTCRDVAQCLHRDTLVLTRKGLKKIKKVTVKDYVWTEKGWEKVVKTLKNSKPTVKITTTSGRELVCSEDHVLHTVDGERAVRELQPGDQVTVITGSGWKRENSLLNYSYEKSTYNNSNRLKEISVPREIDTKLAYVLGVMYGDGHVGLHQVSKKIQTVSVAMADDQPEIKRKYNDFIRGLFGISTTERRGSGALERVDICSRQVLELLSQNGLLKQKSAELIYPEKVFNSSAEVNFSFISGFFDADGSVVRGKKCFKISSVCKDFLLKIQDIFLSYGVVSTLHECVREEENWQTLYSLTINGSRSQKLLRKLCTESVKISSAPEWTKQRDLTRTVYTTTEFNTRSHKHSYIINNKQHLSYSTVERLCKDLDINKEDYILICDYIKKVEPYEENSEVYDLMLDSVHLFSS
jgi:ribonucleoside-diphosphate reductase alpha chain